MAIKYLKIDSDAVRGNTSIAATASNGDTVVVPPSHRLLHVQVPTIATACTMTAKTNLLGTPIVNITSDINGNVYPRSAYTGNSLVTFVVQPGASVVLAATLTGGKKFSVQSSG